jgi:hypothetical protein
MPTGAPGLMPRRSSYASVVSGTASAATQGHQQQARSGVYSHILNQNNESPYNNPLEDELSSLRRNTQAMETDTQRSPGGSGTNSWAGAGRLPSSSRAFAAFTNGHGHEGAGVQTEFFIPSYLQGSKHMQRLEAVFKAKLAARKDASSAQSSQPGSLSKSSSVANLHTKPPPSHRGMTFDVIEKAPPLADDGLAPLPSRWNTHDKNASLEVQGEGLEVKYTGIRASSERDHEASSIRTDHPIPPQCGIYYFEVTILSRKQPEYVPFDFVPCDKI